MCIRDRVCSELRQDIIKELCCNPGHFAASLGTVELTVALHYVYNTPYDRIAVSYTHLTAPVKTFKQRIFQITQPDRQ